MPSFSVSPISIVNQIKSNLQDRYTSGFPILKELLQNADDSEARRFRLDALPGWPAASNPLLQGAGLLVVNDGIFREDDKKGITSFGESSKSSDDAAIGKFGFGQKSVFHLCDAFVVYAYGKNVPFSTVVNPFLDINAEGNVSHTWEPPNKDGLQQADLQFLIKAAGPNYNQRGLILWLPLRRKDLEPAPNLGFSTNLPTRSDTIRELKKTSDLRMLLTALRHIESIDICENKAAACSIKVKEARGRLLGPDKWEKGVRQFGGAMESEVDPSTCKFVAREVVSLDRELAKLKRNPHWPKIIDVRSPKPKPEKGQPHGAVTLLRDKRHGDAKFKISWAVFLPISDDFDAEITVSSSTMGELRLLLHGYFFLDSGRRKIEGLDGTSGDDEPGNASALRESWNTKLRDSAVLPLVPSVLHDALNEKMISGADLLELVRSFARDDWFHAHKGGICNEYALGRILEASGGAAWRLVARDTKMRPLPGILADAPDRIKELFPSIHKWAKSSDACFVIDKNAALFSDSIGWKAMELDAIFAELSPRAFQSRRLAKLLAEFLHEADLGEDGRMAIGPHLVSGVRKAMVETASLADAESIKSILAYVPHGSLLPLPKSVENRVLFRAIASTRCEVLPVRQAWVEEPLSYPLLSTPNLKILLECMQTHIEGRHSDQATMVTLSLLQHTDCDLTSLSNDPDIGPLKVLRARDMRESHSTSLSLKELVDLSQLRVLFPASPEANRLLPALTAALPDQDIFAVEGNAAQFLRESGSPSLSLETAGKAAAFALINEASRFGSEEARLRLFERLDAKAEDDRPALRRLCAGDSAAGTPDSTLWMLERTDSGIERIVAGIVNRGEGKYLIPSSLADELKGRTRDHIGIVELDATNLEHLLSNGLDEVERLQPTPEEREAFLKTKLSNSLLRELPVHTRMDGSVGNAFDIYRVVHDWPIPKSLHRTVPTIKPCNDPNALKRQNDLISPWSPGSQIEVAIAQSEPHRLREDILDALASVKRQVELDSQLSNIQQRPWLLVGGKPISPKDILTLPQSVNEAAKQTLVVEGDVCPFMPDQDLAVDIRKHDGFENLGKWILPDHEDSLARLEQAIRDQAIVARIGSPEVFPVDDYAALAEDGSDLKLPGWPLLSAVLGSKKIQKAEEFEIVAAFSELRESDAMLAASHLDSLAELAAGNRSQRKAARNAYIREFKIIANWHKETRCTVFGNCRVPTVSGKWRPGREVIDSGDGVDPIHVLDGECASSLPASELTPVHASDVESQPDDPDSEAQEVNLAELDVKSVEQQRSFLEAWRGRVPSDLVIVYLGLVGRSAPFHDLAEGWSAGATIDVETLWKDLDGHFPTEILHPNSLAEEVDQRRYLIEQTDDEYVVAKAMSGESINVPLSEDQDNLILGNMHKSPVQIREENGKSRLRVKVMVKKIDLSIYDHRGASRKLRRFIETVASDCLFGMDKQHLALKEVLDKAANVDQSTIEETEHLLLDRLPMVLTELKLPNECRAQRALSNYRDKEVQLRRLGAPAQDIEQLKKELWRSIIEPEMANELLDAVRSKIRYFGYSANRVLFELFQNADDAYTQLDETASGACMRIEMLSKGDGGFRVIHWGRPINHLGSDIKKGRRLGYEWDLLNMLLMNFSEKREGENLTGKFGLGFKSVHILSDDVGVASGFISLRTRGGVIPCAWPRGIDLAEARKRPDGHKATVIDIPFSDSTKQDGETAFEAFRTSAVWIPAFARVIRHIEILDGNSVNINCSSEPIIDESKIDVVTISGTYNAQCLRFGLPGGYSLLLMADANGPRSFPEELRRLWNLAPLEENLPSGWLLNGPFAVDPGRGRLAGSIIDRQANFRRLGRSLGKQLVELFRLVDFNWSNITRTLNFDESENDARTLFWSRLFELFELDFDHDLARNLHVDECGYGHLAARHHVVPTRLPQPFNAPVRASDIDRFTDAALSDPEILEKVQEWRAPVKLKGKIIASEIAGQLVKLGFSGMRRITVADLLQDEIGQECRIDVQLAERLGCVFSGDAIEQEPLMQEKNQILNVAKQAKFLAEDGAWRSVQDISSEYGNSEDEKLLCGFAPDSALLNKNYQGAALEFFKVARYRSGYGPKIEKLLGWAKGADGSGRQLGVLRYVIDGEHGRQLAKVMRSDFPTWVPQPLQRLLAHQLLDEWSDEERTRLLFELGGHSIVHVIPEILSEDRPQADPQTVLSGIHDWWLEEGSEQSVKYAQRIYPTSFSPALLCEGRDRTAWFTMFALACFRSLGRTQDQQHRSFIEHGSSEGWWQDLAESKPPDDVEPWIKRLKSWSESTQFDQSFHLWRRMFVDLYTVARWLDEYIELVVKLPRVIEDLGSISLREALQPSFFKPIELDAAPVNKSLGIGMNWMIREMLRQGAYQKKDSKFLAPYCWASSQRVRDLLNPMGANIGAWADKDASRVIHEFIVEHLDDDRARFDGDFDLPLQLITRGSNRDVLEGCFESADSAPPVIGDTGEDV